MKKVIIGLSVALLAFGAMGCSKDKDTKSAANSVETLAQIEVKSAIHDAKAADPTQALTCKYVLVSGANGVYSVSKAELKTSGSCNFADLQGKAAAAGSLDAAKAAQVVAAVADSSLPSAAKDAFGCTVYNIKTNARKVGIQDCTNGQGVGNAAAKSVTAILGL